MELLSFIFIIKLLTQSNIFKPKKSAEDNTDENENKEI